MLAQVLRVGSTLSPEYFQWPNPQVLHVCLVICLTRYGWTSLRASTRRWRWECSDELVRGGGSKPRIWCKRTLRQIPKPLGQGTGFCGNRHCCCTKLQYYWHRAMSQKLIPLVFHDRLLHPLIFTRRSGGKAFSQEPSQTITQRREAGLHTPSGKHGRKGIPSMYTINAVSGH